MLLEAWDSDGKATTQGVVFKSLRVCTDYLAFPGSGRARGGESSRYSLDPGRWVSVGFGGMALSMGAVVELGWAWCQEPRWVAWAWGVEPWLAIGRGAEDMRTLNEHSKPPRLWMSCGRTGAALAGRCSVTLRK